MTFEPMSIEGAWTITLSPNADERGFFARLWSASEFRQQSLVDRFDQCALSYNRRLGTVRGLHYQAAPREEVKLVRCVRGAIHDVIVDLRPGSPTFKRWDARELTAENRLAVYVPRGVAHGFQTLADDSEVLYLISDPYEPALARGVRWNDPAFGIQWPLPVGMISARDEEYGDFDR